MFDTTYILYNFILINVIVFGFLAEKLDNIYARFICRCIVFMTLLIPASLRYATGTDFLNYEHMFYTPARLQKTEILWQFLNKTVAFCGLSAQWVFVLTGVLVYFPICFVIKREYYCVSVILYVILTFYFKSFNILRQMIAVSFVLWSFVRMEEKHYIKTIILFIIAIGFHKSALVFIPCLLICSINLKYKYLPLLIMIFGVLLLQKINVMNIALIFLEKLGSNYARFLGNDFFTLKKSSGISIGVLLKVVFSISTVILYKRIIQVFPEKKYMINMSLIYVFSFILAAQFVIFGRIRDLFILVPLLVTGNTFDVMGRYRKVLMLFFITINIILFEKEIQNQTRDVFSNSIYPYYSIFYEGEIK